MTSATLTDVKFQISDRAWDIYRRVASVYCALSPDGHDWGKVNLSIAGKDEGFHQPVIWKPLKMCRRCKSFKVKVGFPNTSSGTYDVDDFRLEGQESSTLVISEWDA